MYYRNDCIYLLIQLFLLYLRPNNIRIQIVKEVDFDVFVTGPDQTHEGFRRAIQWCEDHGKEHIVLGRTDGVSSSELKAKIAEKTHRA